MIAVVILVEILARCRSVGNKLSNVNRGLITMRSGQGFTSSNKDNSANFSGEKKYNDAFRGVCFYTARKKTFHESNLVFIVVL